MKAGVKYSVTDKWVDKLIVDYTDAGDEVVYFDDGSLRTGTVLFLKNGRKLWEFVCYEQYLNEWSSDEVCIKYKQLPKKWLKRLEQFEQEQEQLEERRIAI